MIELRYLDAYKQERSQTFEHLDDILRTFAGCMTIPDYLKVISLTHKGKDLGYQGSIGDLYQFLTSLNYEDLQ